MTVRFRYDTCPAEESTPYLLDIYSVNLYLVTHNVRHLVYFLNHAPSAGEDLSYKI